mmetsp:Transcript_37849/g.45630  ORF Transcript_37849/g.45630 Transcript_37849/m.45630 type:complete len:220 (-) Transcript_37849:505-1164(-)
MNGMERSINRLIDRIPPTVHSPVHLCSYPFKSFIHLVIPRILWCICSFPAFLTHWEVLFISTSTCTPVTVQASPRLPKQAAVACSLPPSPSLPTSRIFSSSPISSPNPFHALISPDPLPESRSSDYSSHASRMSCPVQSCPECTVRSYLPKGIFTQCPAVCLWSLSDRSSMSTFKFIHHTSSPHHTDPWGGIGHIHLPPAPFSRVHCQHLTKSRLVPST